MNEIAERKKAAREAATARRATAHETAKSAGSALVAAMDESGLLRPGAIVSGYMPIRTEIDPRPLMRELSRRGHELCLPVIDGADKPLRFRKWSPGSAMTTGPYGAAVPASGAWVEPDLFLVPCLAFDRRGYRLGYGGGYYDRTLAGIAANRDTVAVALAFAAQEMVDLPIEGTDVPVDAVLTEAGHISTRRGAGA